MNKIFTKSKISNRLAIGTFLLVALTTIHHIYGGFRYDTSWRIIMPIFFFLPMLILTLYFQALVLKNNSKVMLMVYSVFEFVGWIAVLGFGEGGYNHVLKNILYFDGASEDLMVKMFPPEFGATKLFEVPNDWFFEITGILTALFGVYALYFLIRFIKERVGSEN